MPLPRTILEEMFQRMLKHHGPSGWWPADDPFEVAVGAILTQNTAWRNVERAIANLKAKGLLSPQGIAFAHGRRLHAAVRPSGYFRQKAHRIRTFSRHLLEHYGGDMEKMARRPAEELRAELLALHGIGPETADDILLYACHKPVFVVDAYTRRILARHGLVDPAIGYEALRAYCEEHLPADLRTYQELHGLIVYTGSQFCRPTPQCDGCPLAPMLTPPQPLL